MQVVDFAMVCSFGRGRMACMVRLLEAGNFAEKSSGICVFAFDC